MNFHLSSPLPGSLAQKALRNTQYRERRQDSRAGAGTGETLQAAATLRVSTATIALAWLKSVV